MPVTLNPITISGLGPTDAQAHVIVTYDSNQLEYTLPWPNAGNLDDIPGFFYLMGDVKFYKDSNGNLIAGNIDSKGNPLK